MLTACGASRAATPVDAFGLPIGQPLTRAELASHRESHLFFPGSKVVRLVGSNQIANPQEPKEPNPAYAGAILTATVTADRLYAFYGQQLRARGFYPEPDYHLASQVSGRTWEVDRRVQVQVGIFDPGLLEQDQNIATAPGLGELVYEVILVGYTKHPVEDSPQTASTGDPAGSH
jgi:hypothetical protein